MELEFKSYCGHQPWFFTPDTGMPGGSAVLIAPDGTQSPVTEMQLSPPRKGFKVPEIFMDPGIYVLTITQTNAKGELVVDTYTINVRLNLVILATEGALGELAQLNQVRVSNGRPPFDLTEHSTANGYTTAEVSAINKFRAFRQWGALKVED